MNARNNHMMKITGKNIFLAWVIAVVAVVVIGGLFLSGTPSRQRARRFDEQRVNDLQSISSAIDQVYNSQTDGGKIPDTLESLRNRRDIYVNSLVDPETNQVYEYRPTGLDAYSLCANFATDGSELRNDRNPSAIYPKGLGVGTDFWDHPAGKKCFEITVQKWNKPTP